MCNHVQEVRLKRASLLRASIEPSYGDTDLIDKCRKYRNSWPRDAAAAHEIKMQRRRSDDLSIFSTTSAAARSPVESRAGNLLIGPTAPRNNLPCSGGGGGKTRTDANRRAYATARFPNSVNMASRYSHGVQRVLAKLEASINSENYYEAHQMYRTLYFRWESADSIASPREGAPPRIREFRSPLTSFAYRYLGQRKYSELLELLYNGSNLLLQHEQVRVNRSRPINTEEFSRFP